MILDDFLQHKNIDHKDYLHICHNAQLLSSLFLTKEESKSKSKHNGKVKLFVAIKFYL